MRSISSERYNGRGLFKLLNRGATKLSKEMGVLIEMETNSGEPRYNCFLKRFFISLCLSLSLIPLNVYSLKEFCLAGMTPKTLPLTKHCTRADVTLSV